MKLTLDIRYIVLIMIAWGMLFLSACYPGQRLAKTYIDSSVDMDFIILSPDFIYKENLKTYLADTAEELTGEELDSLLFYKSSYLKDVNDSIYIRRFAESLVMNMNKLQMKAHLEERLDSLMNSGSRGFMVNVAQILMEEYITPYEPEAVVNGDVITAGAVDLNAVNISTWFELTEMNPPDDEPIAKVLFASDEVTDRINGQFVQYLLRGVVYEYSVDTLKVADLYSAADLLGYKYAMYFYDYFLNRFILKSDPSLIGEDLYYHYDPVRGKAYPINEGFRFVEIEN